MKKNTHGMSMAAIAAGILAFGAASAGAATTYKIPHETDAARTARMAWWTHDRFGMFIHFGLYSCAARHEWVKSIEAIPDDVYDAKYFRHFNPRRLDAKEWAKAAKAAGMKYAVLTTKHHEGFCLWDSKVTDYKSTNTPFGRDIVREFVDAFRAEGLKVGFYYSLLDWHHPDYVVDLVNHPRKGLSWEVYQKLCKGPEPEKALKPYLDAMRKLNAGRDMAKYRQYMRDQITELLTNYGKIDILWYDFSFPNYLTGKGRADWGSEELLTLTRRLQPGIIVNCRLDLMEDPCGYDFLTPEQISTTSCLTMEGRKVAWETCQTFSGSWGYHRDEQTWKSPAQLIAQLVKTVSCGGNLIMNVGPTGRGVFDGRAQDRLAAYARWIEANGDSVYGCGEAPVEFAAPAGTVLTWNKDEKRLFLHVLEWPFKTLPLAFHERVAYAEFLHDGSEVQIRVPSWSVTQHGDNKSLAGLLQLPVIKPDVEVPVIELHLRQ